MNIFEGKREPLKRNTAVGRASCSNLVLRFRAASGFERLYFAGEVPWLFQPIRSDTSRFSDGWTSRRMASRNTAITLAKRCPQDKLLYKLFGLNGPSSDGPQACEIFANISAPRKIPGSSCNTQRWPGPARDFLCVRCA